MFLCVVENIIGNYCKENQGKSKCFVVNCEFVGFDWRVKSARKLKTNQILF